MLSFDLKLSRPGFCLQGKADLPLDGITGITGKSGSGKSTLLRALAGLEPNATGAVSFAGEDWSGRAPQDRPVGFVFQDVRLFRHMDVAQNLNYGAKRRGASKQAVSDVIEAFDLQGVLTRRTASLSGGESRRVALARALATRPKILFLDEPMVGLDTDRRAEVLPYITRAVDEFGLAVLYVSHSLFEMNLLADRILPLSDGQIGAIRPGPPRFSLPVIEQSGGQVGFCLDGVDFRYPGRGMVGESWEIRPGNGAILAQHHPGDNSAAAVLPVVALPNETPGATVNIRLADQILTLPSGVGFQPGHKLWLICPRLRARCRGCKE